MIEARKDLKLRLEGKVWRDKKDDILRGFVQELEQEIEASPKDAAKDTIGMVKSQGENIDDKELKEILKLERQLQVIENTKEKILKKN